MTTKLKYPFTIPGFFYFLILVLDTSYAQSEPDTAKLEFYYNTADKIVREALNERKGYQLLFEFCAIGQRLSGSENSYKAIKWAFEKMKELDFQNVWLQPVLVPHWKRGEKETAKIIASGNLPERELEILALGGSISTPDEGITANVLEVKSFDELKVKKDEAKGKIIFFNQKLDQGLLHTFTSYSNAVNQRVFGAIEAAKYGAIGVLVRSVTTKYDNVPHTGIMYYVDSLPKVPAVSIGYLDADYLYSALLEDRELKVFMKLNCVTLPDAISYNVIGEIVGSEFPDEVIVVGGHLDSWDVGDGAHDNASGCIQIMEVLDLFKRLNLKPKRTIRCVLFINEENGSRGSKEYALFADTSAQKHVAAIESDRGAFTPVGFNVQTDSSEIIEKIRSWLSILERAGIEWIKKGGSGADTQHIKSAIARLGFVPDDQRYMDFHHSANDVFEAVHPREFELGAAAIAIMVFLLSEKGL